ncbi:hypothetical protein GPJ56_009221 [Histomonas meleagridis]|uniref:uncharacterized protein n=1 Tax=Histomonas meleagridis TaxID=135588 RepID=UPI0035597E25|nr:hypothetical protein GPJ56_009221 [Histomonas meleagridis]KAH0801593.1 hypothetical protein GO595_005592 [Histomonas meleagridis]
MWSVLSIDFNALKTSTPKSIMMKNTIQTLIKLVEDENIKYLLQNLLTNSSIDIFSLMKKICSAAANQMDEKDGEDICNFYTQCLFSGSKRMRIPLYSLMEEIIKVHGSFKQHLGQFTRVARDESKSGRIQYADLYLNEIGNEVLEEKPLNSTDPTNFYMFERIVNTFPPLCEMIEDFIDMKDYNGFPPLIIWDDRLLDFDSTSDLFSFKQIIQEIDAMRINPFSKWADMLNKMQESIGNKENKSMKSTKKFIDLDLQNVFQKCLKENFSGVKNTSSQFSLVMKKITWTNDDESEMDKRMRPMGAVITPFSFVPDKQTVEEMCDEWLNR